MATGKKTKLPVQPVQVFLRTRPPTSAEEHYASSLKSLGEKHIEIRQHGGRTYTFDGVFDGSAKQSEIYNTVVKPFIPEVLAGYNCTVFAYGQTGTGKTFTMAGGSAPDNGDCSWEDMASAGLIPRALAHLFDELHLLQTDYTVRVSYLELYNEELYDLLSDSTDDQIRLRIFDDQLKKGSVTVHGIREMTVTNKNEVFQILQKGQEKRRTAATLMNATSSRSHTVFCITVHTRDSTDDGEVLVKIGKLYLVDLAGSENITRAGSASGRARETGSINQSLLTLGRVIKALVERSPHIPYRESKLTRILQDSLGGHTKTSIIATVSLAPSNIEETISTLEYAHRARNITNRPEANQKISQKAYLKHYETQLERLRKDLEAARSGTGIVIAQCNYDRLVAENSSNKELVAEKIARSRILEEELQVTKERIEWSRKEQESLQEYLDETRDALQNTQSDLASIKVEKEDQTLLASYFQEKSADLASDAHKWFDISQQRTKEQSILHEKVEQLRKVAEKNFSTSTFSSNQIQNDCDAIETQLKSLIVKNNEYRNSIVDLLNNISAEHNKRVRGIVMEHQQDTQRYQEMISSQINECQTSIEEASTSTQRNMLTMHNEVKNINSNVIRNLDNTRKCQDDAMKNRTVINSKLLQVISLVSELSPLLTEMQSVATDDNKLMKSHFDDSMDVLAHIKEGNARVEEQIVQSTSAIYHHQQSLTNVVNSVKQCNTEYNAVVDGIYGELCSQEDEVVEVEAEGEHKENGIQNQRPLTRWCESEVQSVNEYVLNADDTSSVVDENLKKIDEIRGTARYCRQVLQKMDRAGDTPSRPAEEAGLSTTAITHLSPADRVLKKFRRTREALAQEEVKENSIS